MTAVGSSTGAAKITGLPFNSSADVSSIFIGQPSSMSGLTGRVGGLTECVIALEPAAAD